MNDNEASVFPGVDRSDKDNSGLSAWFDGCGCWTCTSERVAQSAHPFSMPFIVCPDCGNKRCPKASHHDHECSGSNDTGQAGSRFEGVA